MNPYYQDSHVTIYHKDCGDMSEVEGESVDLIFGDIVYDDHNFVWLDSLLILLLARGSLYLMSDSRNIAELKLALDKTGLLFQNWIIWPYASGGVSLRRYAKKHDDILFYTKSDEYTFNPEKIRIVYDTPFFGIEAYDKYVTDVWQDISKEVVKSDWEWAKPEALMVRIIQVSSNEGNLILDPFLGSGTTAYCAKKLNRKCIGYEIEEKYCEIAANRCRQMVMELEV